jgi:hypothetical protein
LALLVVGCGGTNVRPLTGMQGAETALRAAGKASNTDDMACFALFQKTQWSCSVTHGGDSCELYVVQPTSFGTLAVRRYEEWLSETSDATFEDGPGASVCLDLHG